jgi:hypothetical protein
VTPAEAFAAARPAIDAARAAPQSRRKAMLAALLLDAAIDALFEASGQDDVLAFRSNLELRHAELKPILDLAAMEDTTLVLEPVEIAIGDYPALGVEDFMISLYNGRIVPRVLIVSPQGARIDVHEALASALAALEAEAQR